MMRERGFTLLELLVTVSVVASMAYIAWGAYGSVQKKAEDELARAEMLRLADALRRFKADTGFYPGQGPFALAPIGTAEIWADGKLNCTPASGNLAGAIPRTWVPPAEDDHKTLWFNSPANIALLVEAPVLCSNHPLAFLAGWNPETQRGWHGPYLDRSARAWVDHGSDLNASTVVMSAPDGTGNPVAGSKLLDIPAFGAGPKLRPSSPFGKVCSTSALATPGANCMLGWRSVPRAQTGYEATSHEHAIHARPFLMFGLVNNDFPRIVYVGLDGRYGGRNLLTPCNANTGTPDGLDDLVLCLN